MIYLKRSYFDILLYLIVFYEGGGDVRVCEGWHYKWALHFLDGLFSKIRLSGIFDYPNNNNN